MPSLRNGWTALAGAILLAGGLTLPAAKAEAPSPSALFIIDGSGSMWGRFEASEEKRAKIDTVRDLVRPIIDSDKRSRIGLQSFGHRRRGDCSDVEIIAPPATDRAGVLAALDKLNPRGKGPLAEALRQASSAVGSERPASVIVINDGIDNCRQDACAAAAEFAKTAAGVPVHMLSIGIEPSEQAAVQCIAKATGGKFYDIRDPVALAAALEDVTSLALGTAQTPAAAGPPSGPQTPEQAAAAAALPQAAVRATLALADGMKPLAEASRWQLLKAGSSTPLRTMEAAGIAENVEPGDYTLVAEHAGLIASAPVTIEAGKSVTVALSLKAARLTVKSKAAQASAILAVKETTDGKVAGRTLALQKLDGFEAFLRPGQYLVSVFSGGMRQEKTVKLAEGDDTAAEFDGGNGSLALSATTQEGGPPLADAVFSIQEDDPDSPGGRREVRRSHAPEPRFNLPAGTYYAVVRSGLAEARQRIAVSAGDALEKALLLPAADVKISASVGSAAAPDTAGLVFRIFTLESEQPREIARSAGPSFSGLLNAGRYRISAVLEKHGAGVSQDVVVEAGKPLSRVLRIEAGEIALKSPVATADSFWEVRDAAGKAVWHAAMPEPRVLLAPGRYSVRLDQQDKTIEAAFDIAAGESKTIDLGSHR